MEEGVISQLLRAPIHPLFGDSHMRLTDVSGAGNNWACGYANYGPQYSHTVMDLIRRNLEYCESPQAFLLLHSLGGGTGSGFGSYILEQIADHFPEQYRFTSSLMPSRNDDVITSPYNNLLATARLIECADAVLPIDNQRLIDVINTTTKQVRTADKGSSSVMNLSRLPILTKSTQIKKSNSNVTTSNNINNTNNDSLSNDITNTASSVPSSNTTISPALEQMLAQADAVLDAVSHGLIAASDSRVPSKSSTTNIKKSSIESTKPTTSSNTKGTTKIPSGIKAPSSSRTNTLSSRTTSTGNTVPRPSSSLGTTKSGNTLTKPSIENTESKVPGKGIARVDSKTKMDVASNIIRNRGNSLTSSKSNELTATDKKENEAILDTSLSNNGIGSENTDNDNSSAAAPSTTNTEKRRSGTPYDAMNTLVAHMVSFGKSYKKFLPYDKYTIHIEISIF